MKIRYRIVPATDWIVVDSSVPDDGEFLIPLQLTAGIQTIEVVVPDFDLNDDGFANIIDRNIAQNNFQQTGPNAADFNLDGIVNNADIAMILAKTETGTFTTALGNPVPSQSQGDVGTCPNYSPPFP